VPPTQDHPRERATTLTADADRAPEDVARARAGVRNAGVTFGPRASRRTLGSSWRHFADRYGWRAYALPILVVITVAALLTTNQVRKHTAATGGVVHPAAPAVSQPPVAPASIDLKDDAAGSKVNDTVLKAAALPTGAAYTTTGAGTFRTLKGTTPKVGSGQLYRYSIDVENGIDDVDLAQFQSLVVSVLSDSRSWSGHGVALQRVDSGPRDFRISLTSAMTVRKLCGYTIHVETSCYAQAGGPSDVNRVVFNDARWARGSAAYVGDLASYRIYMINHEDGHALGHEHAHQCLPGGLAPVMMQQTFGLRSAKTDKMCAANPWPYPPGVIGTPGAEQQDTPANDEYGLGD
jgi:uncharacterized protein DUF3152